MTVMRICVVLGLYMRKTGPIQSAKSAGVIGAALLAVLLAGCSSESLRLGGLDNFTTATVPTPQENVGQGGMGQGMAAPQQAAASQPYPGDQSYSSGQYALAPTGGVQRSQLAPTSSAPMAPDTMTTATTPVATAPVIPPATASANRPRGWSTEGAPRVTVQPNETLFSISQRYGVPVEQIMQANGISNASQIRSGQQIVIPGYSRGGTVASAAPAQPAAPAAQQTAAASPAVDPRLAERSLNEQAAQLTAPAASAPSAGGSTYTVKAGDTLSRISRETGVSVAALRQANNISGDNIRLGQTLNLGGAAAPQPAATAVAQASAQQPRVDPQQTAAVTTAAAAPAAQPQQPAAPQQSYTPPAASEPAARIDDAVGNDVAAIAPEATGIGKLRWPVRSRSRKALRSMQPRTASSFMQAPASRNTATPFWCVTTTAWSRSTAMQAS
jgi:LysM repeat protein